MLLGRCTTVVNRDGNYEGYGRNQAANESTNTRTDKITRKFSMCHLHPKHHTICHPSKQEEAK